MSNIVLNKSNITNSNNNSELSYKFPRDVVLDNHEIVLSHLNLYYSWFNVSAANNNNKFSYIWPWVNSGSTEFQVVLEDGYYSVSTLYEVLITHMVANGHFLVLSSDPSKYVYFIELAINPTFYAVEIQLSSLGKYMSVNGSAYTKSVAPVPAGDAEQTPLFQTPTGWTVPDGDVYETPSVNIPLGTNFGNLIGFNQNSTVTADPSGATINSRYSIPNDFVATLNPQNSFIITCSLVSNNLSNPNNVLASFSVPGGAVIGSQISPVTDIVWSQIAPGQYSELRLQILDQDYKPLVILDDSMLFVVSIRAKNGGPRPQHS